MITVKSKGLGRGSKFIFCLKMAQEKEIEEFHGDLTNIINNRYKAVLESESMVMTDPEEQLL